MSPHAIETLLADYHELPPPKRPLTIRQTVTANARATHEAIARIIAAAKAVES